MKLKNFKDNLKTLKIYYINIYGLLMKFQNFIIAVRIIYFKIQCRCRYKKVNGYYTIDRLFLLNLQDCRHVIDYFEDIIDIYVFLL